MIEITTVQERQDILNGKLFKIKRPFFYKNFYPYLFFAIDMKVLLWLDIFKVERREMWIIFNYYIIIY